MFQHLTGFFSIAYNRCAADLNSLRHLKSRKDHRKLTARATRKKSESFKTTEKERALMQFVGLGRSDFQIGLSVRAMTSSKYFYPTEVLDRCWEVEKKSKVELAKTFQVKRPEWMHSRAGVDPERYHGQHLGNTAMSSWARLSCIAK